MKKLIIPLLILFFPFSFYAQQHDYIKEMEEDDLQIRQKPGTEKELTAYLAGIPSRQDTLYAIFYVPANCPRCEAKIRPFCTKMKQANPDNEILLISVYKDKEAAARYNQTHQYMADHYLYDTDDRYRQLFSFNTGYIVGVYILKLCKSTGILLTGGDPPSIGKDFVNQLTTHTRRMPTHTYIDEITDIGYSTTARTPSVPLLSAHYTDHPVSTDNIHIPSEVLNHSLKYTDKELFYTDKLENGIMLFREVANGNLQFQSLLQTDEKEKNRFVNVPPHIFRSHMENGMIAYMPLYAEKNGTELLISYSIPNLTMETEITDNDTTHYISYFNAPVLLHRQASTLAPDSMAALDFQLTNPENHYFYQHFTFHQFDGKVIFNCNKLAFPMQYSTEEYKGNPEMDPFMNEFYQRETPYLALFDARTGKLIRRFGKLSEAARKSRTGYYFTEGIATSYADDLLYTDGFSGQIYVAPKQDIDHVKEHHSLFEVETNLFPQADSTKLYTREYMQTYNRYFDRCIESVRMRKDSIYALIRYAAPDKPDVRTDEYSFVRIDRRTGKIEEHRLPRYEGYEVLGYELKDETEACPPFVFLKGKDGYKVRVWAL